MTGGSQGGRLLDAVEADPCGRRGDGHGPGHRHSEGVMVLPAVPPFPHSRAHLRGVGWAAAQQGLQAPIPEPGAFSPAPAPCGALKGREAGVPSRPPLSYPGRHWLVPKAGPSPEAVSLGSSCPLSSPLLEKLPAHPSLGRTALPAPLPPPSPLYGGTQAPASKICFWLSWRLETRELSSHTWHPCPS